MNCINDEFHYVLGCVNRFERRALGMVKSSINKYKNSKTEAWFFEVLRDYVISYSNNFQGVQAWEENHPSKRSLTSESVIVAGLILRYANATPAVPIQMGIGTGLRRKVSKTA